MVSGMEEEISDRSNLKEFSTSQFAQTQITFVNTMEEKELDKSISKEEGELDDDDSLLWQPSITFLPDIAFSKKFCFSKFVRKKVLMPYQSE